MLSLYTQGAGKKLHSYKNCMENEKYTSANCLYLGVVLIESGYVII